MVAKGKALSIVLATVAIFVRQLGLRVDPPEHDP
jgi:hypothetical protein